MLKKPCWVLLTPVTETQAGCHWHLAKLFAFVRCGETELEAVKQSRPFCHSRPERRISLMLTALLIQAHADVHTNTHTNAQRCGARARPNSNIFVFPSRTLAGEGEKKNQKDCRLEKRDFCRGTRKTREDKWTESSRGEARNWKDSKLYTSLSGNYTHTPEHHKTLSHFVSVSNTRHKNYIQPWMCILAYCNRTLSFLSAHHFQGKGVGTSVMFSPGEHLR